MDNERLKKLLKDFLIDLEEYDGEYFEGKRFAYNLVLQYLIENN